MRNYNDDSKRIKNGTRVRARPFNEIKKTREPMYMYLTPAIPHESGWNTLRGIEATIEEGEFTDSEGNRWVIIKFYTGDKVFFMEDQLEVIEE